MNREQKTGLETRLLAYSVATGAAMVMAPAAQADIIYYEGPWLSSGSNKTLISFNLAGEVMTDGTHVADEQFYIDNASDTDLPIGAKVSQHSRDMFLYPGDGFGTEPVETTTTTVVHTPGSKNKTKTNTTTQVSPVTVGAVIGPLAAGDPIGPGGQEPGPVSRAVVTHTLLSNTKTKTLEGQHLRGQTTAADLKTGGVDILRSNGPWANETQITVGTTKGIPLFRTVAADTRGYLGLQFDGPGDGTFFGWADITLGASSNSLTLWGYAYEDSGGSILAGAGVPAPGGPGVPEPSSIALFTLGATGVAALRRRRKEMIEAPA